MFYKTNLIIMFGSLTTASSRVNAMKTGPKKLVTTVTYAMIWVISLLGHWTHKLVKHFIQRLLW